MKRAIHTKDYSRKNKTVCGISTLNINISFSGMLTNCKRCNQFKGLKDEN